MPQHTVTGGDSLVVEVNLEDGRVRPRWTIDVSSAADALVTGKNQHGETVALDLDEGILVAWILDGCLRGQIENWHVCAPEEPTAAQLKQACDDRAYWHIRTGREAGLFR